MEGASGRRVLLVLSPGIDHGSVNRPDILRHSLAGQGATVFGAVPAEFRGASVSTFADHDQPFALLCGGTGGLMVAVNRGALASWLGDTLRLLRERYVLEFARPANESAGLHQLDVKTEKQSDHVYVSGVTVPLRDAKLAQDPYTIPNAPDRAPVVGTRKMLQPH